MIPVLIKDAVEAARRRQRGVFCSYIEGADDAVNKDDALIG